VNVACEIFCIDLSQLTNQQQINSWAACVLYSRLISIIPCTCSAFFVS
jgi:hypothetical protein